MADNDGYNSAQAQLGLVGSGSFANFGVPTPGFAPPAVRAPGEISVAATQAATAASMMTVQSAMITRPGAMSPPSTPLGMYSQQYQANMGAMNAQIVNPYTANYMSPGGFNSLFPAATMMTSPSMGIFRPPPNPMMPSIPMVPPPAPILPAPFTPRPASSMFQTPFEYGQNLAVARGDHVVAASLAAPGVIARMASDTAGAFVGGALGARFGAHFGPMGARVGAAVGGIGGLLGTEFSEMGATAQHIVDGLNPMRTTMMRAAGIQTGSQGYAVGGSHLAANGRGLDSTSSIHLARILESASLDPQFRRETGGLFSSNDMMKLTNMAGQQGLLDPSNNPEQIKNTVVRLAKNMRVFMQLANEPDMQEALKQLGQFRAMGFEPSEARGMMMNARMYSRMAGTSVRGVIEAGGLQGAQIFQQNGLTAATGMQLGVGNYGLARLGVGAGAYSPSELAMLGGVSGIAQRATMNNAAFLKMPMMTAALSSATSTGAFGLNSSAIGDMISGKTNINDMAVNGANNLAAAVAKHGIGALGMFQMQQPELQDQLGRTLGPVGMEMAQMLQIRQTMKMLGVTGPGGFATAAMAHGMDENSARQMMKKAGSPAYFNDLRRQLNRSVSESRAIAFEERQRSQPGLLDDLEDYGSQTGFTLNPLAMQARGATQAIRGGRQLLENARGFGEGVGQFFQEFGEDRRLGRTGQFALRTPDSLLAQSPAEERRIAALRNHLGAHGVAALQAQYGQGQTGSALFRVGGEAFGRNGLTDYLYSYQGGDSANLASYRRTQGGLSATFGGGLMEYAARNLTYGHGFVKEDDVRKGLASVHEMSQMLQAGLNATSAETGAADSAVDKVIGKGKGTAFNTIVGQKLAMIAKSKKGVLHNGSLTKEDMARAIKEAAHDQGIRDPKLINQLLAQQKTIGVGAATLAKQFATNDIKDVITNPESGEARDLRTVDGRVAAQQDLATQAFGSRIFGEGLAGTLARHITGASLFSESDSQRREAVNKLFGNVEDPRSATYAALSMASQNGDAEATKQLHEFVNENAKDMRKISSEASGLKDDKKMQPFLLDLGKSLHGKSASQINAFARAMQKSNDTIKAAGGVGETAHRILGGILGGTDEAGFQKQKKMVDGMEGAMKDVFPESVDTFQQSVKVFAEAARAFGQGHDDDLDRDKMTND